MIATAGSGVAAGGWFSHGKGFFRSPHILSPCIVAVLSRSVRVPCLQAGQLRSDWYDIMWQYYSKIGTLEIRLTPEGRYQLSIGESRIDSYESAHKAAEAVHLGITGYEALDRLYPWELPHGLYQWETGEL